MTCNTALFVILSQAPVSHRLAMISHNSNTNLSEPSVREINAFYYYYVSALKPEHSFRSYEATDSLRKTSNNILVLILVVG